MVVHLSWLSNNSLSQTSWKNKNLVRSILTPLFNSYLFLRAHPSKAKYYLYDFQQCELDSQFNKNYSFTRLKNKKHTKQSQTIMLSEWLTTIFETLKQISFWCIKNVLFKIKCKKRKIFQENKALYPLNETRLRKYSTLRRFKMI